MKILIEFFKEGLDRGETAWIQENDKTLEFKVGSKTERISQAKAKLLELKSTIQPNEKIRIHECNHGEIIPRCKILEEL